MQLILLSWRHEYHKEPSDKALQPSCLCLRIVPVCPDFFVGPLLSQGSAGWQAAGSGVRAFLESCGITEVRTAYRSPWQNPFVERYIGTLRREMLDHVIVLNQGHLERLLREFIEDYYHVARPHQGLAGDTPVSQTKQAQISGPSKLISIPVLGGLHHRYVRVAA